MSMGSVKPTPSRILGPALTHGSHGVDGQSATAPSPDSKFQLQDWLKLVQKFDWNNDIILSITPNLFGVCKNFTNESCRATCILQLCWKVFSLILYVFQAIGRQSRVEWNRNAVLT
jgi:acetone carboxylase gamma subunit